MSMKKHEVEFLLGYGIKHYTDRVSSSADGNPNDGKWYNRLETGFVCGDKYTVIRFYSLDNYKVLKDIP
jgi:hypothetical protein